MSVEDRVREALREHAEDFTAHPDAWQQLRARRAAGSRRRAVRRRPWPARFIGPAAAAAAVVVIVLAAAAVSGAFDGAGNSGAAGTSPTGSAAPGRSPATTSPAPPLGPYASSGPAEMMLATDPPVSAIIGLKVPWTGPQKKPDRVTGYFWLSYGAPSYWLDQVLAGPQFCNDTVNVSTGESGGFCWPLPQLGAGHLASVTGNENDGTNQRILLGAAAAQVTSVTAVLPDGRTFAGAVKTGRGFSGKAWIVGYPPSAGVRLVFRNAAGQQVTTLGTARPDGPPQEAQPRTSGVTLFRYPAGNGLPAGSLVAYLVQGHVGFWSSFAGGLICPVAAAGQPALGGIAVSFGEGGTNPKAFGYAHANVTRIVLSFRGGSVSGRTVAAGWPGSSIRLWSVSLPADLGLPQPAITATGYDAAGHVIERVKLGSSGFS
jgi:hypothetical protein